MLLKNLCNWFLDSLFPLAREEDELFLLSPDKAWQTLAKAPKPPVSSADSVFAYKDERVRKLIWNIKYKRSAKAVAIGGYALFVALKSLPKNSEYPPILIPMPITPKRLLERGYNQCQLLVDEVTRLDIDHKFSIEKELLLRVHHDSRQTLKNRQERLASTKGIFEVNKEKASGLSNRTIIVIDDVITTGSTINEAMAALRNAGLRNVSGLSLAH